MKKNKNKESYRIGWLTNKEKVFWLKRLEEAKADGTIDDELVPYLEEINAIDCICTCFCCIGHETTKSEPRHLGYLIIRLKRPARDYFWKNIFLELLKLPGIRFIDTMMKDEKFDKGKGRYPFIQIAWDWESWPGVINPIVKNLKKLKKL